jgi:hypothetical protein
MTNSAKPAVYVTRDAILKLLSNEEIGRVSSAEVDSRIVGSDYLDLEHLDRGVQNVYSVATKITMGNVLPRSAVNEETWSKILAQLAGSGQVSL